MNDSPASILFDISGSNIASVSGSLGIHIAVSGAVHVTNAKGIEPSQPLYARASVYTHGAQLVSASLPLPVSGTVSIDGTTHVSGVILAAGLDPSGSTRVPIVGYDGSLYVKNREEETFVCTATAITIGNNKSMLSIVNASVGTIVKIREIWMMNVQTTSVTGIAGKFELRRITGHCGGTLITAIQPMDTTDVLSSGITGRTGATVSGEGDLIWRKMWSTDEWGPGTLDQEGSEHTFQNMTPIYQRQDPSLKPITLWPGQGLSVKHVVNSTAGTFDVFVVFTQVVDN